MLDGGELYILGRLKELIVIHGRKLHPHDIETMLQQRYADQGLRFAAAFSVPVGETEGLVVLQEVRGRANKRTLPTLAANIQATITRELGVSVAGVVLLPPGTIERTTSGKVRRAAMRAKFLSGPAELRALCSVVHPTLAARIGVSSRAVRAREGATAD